MYSGSRKATTALAFRRVIVQCSDRCGPIRYADSSTWKSLRRIVGPRQIGEDRRPAADREVAPVREHLGLLQPDGRRDHAAVLVERQLGPLRPRQPRVIGDVEHQHAGRDPPRARRVDEGPPERRHHERDRRQHVERVRLRRLHHEPVADVDQQHAGCHQDPQHRPSLARRFSPLEEACTTSAAGKPCHRRTGRHRSTNIQIGCAVPMIQTAIAAGASQRCRWKNSSRLAPSVAMNRMISRLPNDRNRASVVAMIQGLTQCGWRLRSTPPDPAFSP